MTQPTIELGTSLRVGLAITLRQLLEEHGETAQACVRRAPGLSVHALTTLLDADRWASHLELVYLADAFGLRVGELHETAARAARVPVQLARYVAPRHLIARQKTAAADARRVAVVAQLPAGPAPHCPTCGRPTVRVKKTGRPPKLCACPAGAKP